MVTKNRTAKSLLHGPVGRRFSRTALPIIAVGVVLLAAGMYGAWRVHRLQKRGSEILADNVSSIRAGEEFESACRELRYRIRRFTSEPAEERHAGQVAMLRDRARRALQTVRQQAKSTEERDLAERMTERFAELAADLDSGLSAPFDESAREQLRVVSDDLIPEELLRLNARYIAFNERELDRSKDRNRANANHLMLGLLLLGTCGGVAGLIAGYAIARRVDRTIVELAIPIRDTAGKLNQVAGPVAVSAAPGFADLQTILERVSDHVTLVVERLQESERDRLRAEQLAVLGQLAAGLAHELRNPLTSMKAILQLAREPSELNHEELEILREETSRLESTVQSLLDFARPPRPAKAPTDLGALLEQTAQLVRRQTEDRDITLTYLPPPRPIVASADGGQLRQVLLNLLVNAVEATPRGGDIVLECRMNGCPPWFPRPRSNCASEGGPMDPGVTIVVRDSGPGLPGHLGDRIFEPFVTTREAGTGLGLSISRRIANAHGGRLEARNGEQGAIFELFLPIPESNP